MRSGEFAVVRGRLRPRRSTLLAPTSMPGLRWSAATSGRGASYDGRCTPVRRACALLRVPHTASPRRRMGIPAPYRATHPPPGPRACRRNRTVAHRLDRRFCPGTPLLRLLPHPSSERMWTASSPNYPRSLAIRRRRTARNGRISRAARRTSGIRAAPPARSSVVSSPFDIEQMYS